MTYRFVRLKISAVVAMTEELRQALQQGERVMQMSVSGGEVLILIGKT